MNTLLLATVLIAQPADSALRFQMTKESTSVIATLPAARAAKLPLGRLDQDAGEAILMLSRLSDDKTAGPAMLGKYERAANELSFTPRFPLDAGSDYRATLMLDGKAVTLDYRAPLPPTKAPPKVVKVYPTTNVLPANHLKFYIYFDRPMRGGKELFNLIQLVDDKGKVITDAWLFDEIWDEENNCLIIFIHPGRIKWGVELREQLGPVLYEKRSYSFVVKGTLTDLDGRKLGQDYVKKFTTTPEDRVRIDLSQWKLTAPKIGSTDPLLMRFSKSIDHRSLQRFLSIVDDKGARVQGAMGIGPEEKSWTFTPTSPWRGRGYTIDVDGRLEDVAGNTPLLPFDHDLKSPKLPPQKLSLELPAK